MWAAGLTLFLLGIMFIIVYFSVKGKHTRCSAQTQGTLRKIQKNTSSDTGTGRNEYFYSYSVNGIEYQLKTVDKSPDTNEVGDNCTIWYNPSKPKQALAHYYHSFKLFKILLYGGILMILLGIVLFLIGMG